jgi:hypothetical protein
MFVGGKAHMAWFADLSQCDYFGAEHADCLRAVGWLERDHAFPTGVVDLSVYSRLVELVKDAWQPGVFMGSHSCDLCIYAGERGNRNLFIPAGRQVFVVRNWSRTT